MSDKLKLAAEKRTEFGKGAARRARMAHKIPAVIYGHGADPLHVLLPGHETMMTLKHSNALITVAWDDESQMVLAKDVQRHAVKRTIEHVDLLIVRKGEKVTVDIPVHVVGDSFPGTVAVTEHNTLSIEAEATHIPESVEVSIEGLEEGQKVTAGDVKLPAGSTLVTDPDTTVVAISVPRGTVSEEEEAAAEEAAESAAGPSEADSE
ncbi:50S ribosomal protein L25/general stress protein Ctc [Demequina sp. TTPB684]|uniref:50S ribosomal protein L25/general stress protein Ctc n=1 Tax=unclassified Demequina TaxID=2620311 RepID=UPI001CF25595|nr:MULTISPECIES: 50S ribosomal protein L25/general stress protein Ctc [unclassified Demequina]MCB2411886.1 50S ribosomal protein L25/general stress protein Ctc [Demequina sp. TTPB684]UPU87372.1 50S ribosomal protein L25/general stress protein Ctc [Demequina sp. TMPB413]